MRTAIVLDDPLTLSFLSDKCNSFVKSKKDICGIECFEATYNNSKIDVFLFQDTRFLSLRIEDLFLSKEIDLLLSVGICYSLDLDQFSTGNMVFLDNVQCDSDASDMAGSRFSSPKSYLLDDDLRDKILKSIDQKKALVLPADCFSSASFFNRKGMLPEPLAPLVDLKSFSFHEVSSLYNKKAVCFCVVKDIDICHYNTDWLSESFDELLSVVLEFICKC